MILNTVFKNVAMSINLCQSHRQNGTQFPDEEGISRCEMLLLRLHSRRSYYINYFLVILSITLLT